MPLLHLSTTRFFSNANKNNCEAPRKVGMGTKKQKTEGQRKKQNWEGGIRNSINGSRARPPPKIVFPLSP
ncbi:hypothetical protein I7I50_10348 [Histoplasma capsulatum G186AR]|uniref:Uncharacterized protein n=1 Tax=Ajellomyces capsulatus TaxID=5037 RepID=A0A8H8D7E8_AJECA|nr:hypothetical protein I7I52_01587 [Histoplasma capsulatum]QSS69154.1 hypothetical protein I7I50_10348 [Histoplasma capsulatum G186AR]